MDLARGQRPIWGLPCRGILIGMKNETFEIEESEVGEFHVNMLVTSHP
jgi:hypothetical protein